MTRWRRPELCERDKLSIGLYDLKSKRKLTRSIKQRDVCVYIQKNHYWVIWKKNSRDGLLNGVEEIERNFKYVIKNENNLNHRIHYRFPKHEAIDQLENVLVFDLETYNDQEFAEAYPAGLYDVNRLRDRWKRDFSLDEIGTKKDNVNVFDGSSGNSVMDVLKYISEIYDWDEGTYIDGDGDEINSSYRLFLVAHNASDFDSWVVLNSLVKEITELKILKIVGDWFHYRFGVVFKHLIQLKYLSSSILHVQNLIVEDLWKKLLENTGFILNFSKEKSEHSVVDKSNFAYLRAIWESYLKLDVLRLALKYGRHSTEMQHKSGFGIKNCLTEASLRWKCFAKNNKERKFYTFNDNYFKDFIRK